MILSDTLLQYINDSISTDPRKRACVVPFSMINSTNKLVFNGEQGCFISGNPMFHVPSQ
jgi:hypothetical protein